MQLYYAPGACSLASHIIAEEANIPLDYQKVDLASHRTENGRDYSQVNPKGSVPALRLDDGSILTENVAILPFLASLNPDAGLVPDEGSMEHFRLHEWLGFIASELHKSFRPLFGSPSVSDRQKAENVITTRLAYVESQLRDQPYLLGSHWSVADAYLFVMLTWCETMKIDIAQWPHLSAFYQRFSNRPKVKAAMRAEGLLH